VLIFIHIDLACNILLVRYSYTLTGSVIFIHIVYSISYTLTLQKKNYAELGNQCKQKLVWNYVVVHSVEPCKYLFGLTFYYLCTQDLLDALNQLEVGLKENLKLLSSFDKYKQQVLLGHLDWSPMHKDPNFWRENITNFEENDFQVCPVLS
jgi:hypothetical protein